AAMIARLSGQVAVAGVARRLVASLRDAGFLDDDRFAEMRGAREREFAAKGERASAHAGTGYPSESAALTDTLANYFDGAPPFGSAPTETALVDELVGAGGAGVTLEDYCHAVEHSIEFQVVFLQYLYGPRVRILPVLCGAFVAGAESGRLPEASDQVARFVG